MIAKHVRNTYLYVIIVSQLVLISATSVRASELDQLMSLKQASVHVVDSQGDALVEKNADLPLIPASTIKLLTAYVSIQTWGLQHRFNTEFYLDDDFNLWVKGLGDPYLISEELDIVVSNLKQRGLTKINHLILDNSFFDPGIRVNGQSNSNNPYDAPLGALAVNFNTINVIVSSRQVLSAEKQTPITPLAQQLGRQLSNGKQRINLGSADLGPRYFSELLTIKLSQEGIDITGSVSYQSTPEHTPLFYRHENSRTLEDVIAAMLKYSNNFIANQLYLLIGAENSQSANMQQSSNALQHFIDKTFGWQSFSITEGAGLSRDNRMSASQLTELLIKMLPYVHLLPEKDKGIVAKTGTLNGIKTYAGYFRHRQQLLPFAILINQKVSWAFRKEATHQLKQKAERLLLLP